MELVRTLRYRIRYNPPQRLVLNALKRVGIIVLPYYVFARRLVPAAGNGPGGNTGLVELGAQDMARIAAPPLSTNSETTFRNRLLEDHRCFGLTVGGTLLAYNWMSPVSCKVNGEWLELRPDQAYAYDIYTVPEQRGRNLAGMLNAHFSEWLLSRGVTTVLSVVDYYNRPSLTPSARSTVKVTGPGPGKLVFLSAAYPAWGTQRVRLH